MDQQPRWFPRKMTALTLIVFALLAVVKIFLPDVVELTQIGPDLLSAFSILAVVALFFCWLIWCLFFSPFRLVGKFVLTAAVLVVPVLFFTFYQPQFGGSMNVRAFHYRFAPAQESVVFESANGRASLLDESGPFSFSGFLGNERTGIVDGPELESDWSVSPPELVWKRAVGAGWSGVAIAGGYLVTMEQRGADEVVTCYRLDDGEPVWDRSMPVRHEDLSGLGRQGPRSTPTIWRGMVITQGATGILMGLNGDSGEVVWEVDLCKLLKIGQHQKTNSAGFKYTYEKSRLSWGRSASPLIVDDLVVVPGGYGDDHPEAGATLVALDAGTGELKWKSGDEMIAYGSPSLAMVAGTRQILLQAENQAMGFDAETGRVLWKYARAGNSNGDANCSQVTFVDQGRLLLTKGYNLGGEMIRVSRTGEEFSVKQEWPNSRILRTKFSFPVVRNDLAWSISDGFIECVDLKAGRQVWKQRDRYGDGQLLLVGNWLVIQSEFGELRLVQATAENPKMSLQVPSVSGVCWNTLAISNDMLVVRSDQEMACFRLKTAGASPTAIPNDQTTN